MCTAITCRKCGKVTWTGCGKHVAQVLQGVPDDRRCAGHAEERPVGLLARLRRR